ncbi:DUF4405 domain-containing protein [Tropicimonas isoalkanivorans]|uniref:Flavinylation-associated cytochrome domain-containing protein n=1 Tax=Tropicimonas isoalkanivorans TaxID=441112 RepID=A0A1I1KAT9_9RHOB|nr:DUF4405 domain-containing protein [Tropicimonas isoalkanivorans]SFC55798.1 protein of unknown function [Tropicimonas isoalkanivorans]
MGTITQTAAHTASSDHSRHAPLSGRAFAAFGVSLTFVLMLVSGIMLYVAPNGRMAYEVGWTLLGLGRPGWEAVHIATAVVFVAVVAWHFLLHLRVYRTLLAGTPIHPTGHRREALLALAAVALVALVAILAWPPASWVVDGNSYFKRDHWSSEAALPTRPNRGWRSGG